MKPPWLDWRSLVLALMLGVGAQFLVGAAERAEAATDLCPWEICQSEPLPGCEPTLMQPLGCCDDEVGPCTTEDCFECAQGWCWAPPIGCAS